MREALLAFVGGMSKGAMRVSEVSVVAVPLFCTSFSDVSFSRGGNLAFILTQRPYAMKLSAVAVTIGIGGIMKSFGRLGRTECSR